SLLNRQVGCQLRLRPDDGFGAVEVSVRFRETGPQKEREGVLRCLLGERFDGAGRLGELTLPDLGLGRIDVQGRIARERDPWQRPRRRGKARRRYCSARPRACGTPSRMWCPGWWPPRAARPPERIARRRWPSGPGSTCAAPRATLW